ncbi:Na/Pi cotransporter family protein [Psychrobacter sp. FDAARGOS_221]|uniref:Na/Pi cotransporter family protein n=1 Tax=Psychrobacter sp. FDAARGOS_221 TaxID=1975705 RepID=UPI000BB55378|nr:Na/Pi symporter [Psychrobacter sp. FDAARGOS_221]PNK60860.1 Na/Pi cotransporter family protein [Psychrobacter sp. FDAARGOS_221]
MKNRYLNSMVPVFVLRHISKLKYLGLTLLIAALVYSFLMSSAWLVLCYGLALFLFGMQCIESGLHNAAGGTLERLMAKSTETPVKGFLFGIGSTFLLQSTTLVSLLTIAFLSTGMITLAGGLAVILGTNLGASSGAWLLALAGQSISLSPAAIPMLVVGVLLGFLDSRLKALGQALIGIALIFLGIDSIKDGFGAFNTIELSGIEASGVSQVLLFTFIGFILTCVLQSSHATLILILAALSAQQITLPQGFAIALGSNLGSSFTTALVGMLSSDRNGQRLALAHLIFNWVTALLSLILWLPLTYLVSWIAIQARMPSPLLQLALFHTLFNVLGLSVFWGLQNKLVQVLVKILPDKKPKKRLPDDSEAVLPRHLHSNMLKSTDTAIYAVTQEVQHLAILGLEVVCHAIYIPNAELYHPSDRLPVPKTPLQLDVQSLYEWQIKPLYSDILSFTSKIDIQDNKKLQKKLTDAHIAAFHVVEIVKQSKHLQKNMQHFLSHPEAQVYQDYMQLRQSLFEMLLSFNQIRSEINDNSEQQSDIDRFIEQSEYTSPLHAQVLEKLRAEGLDKLQASSLINDMNYVRRISSGLSEILISLATPQDKKSQSKKKKKKKSSKKSKQSQQEATPDALEDQHSQQP